MSLTIKKNCFIIIFVVTLYYQNALRKMQYRYRLLTHFFFLSIFSFLEYDESEFYSNEDLLQGKVRFETTRYVTRDNSMSPQENGAKFWIIGLCCVITVLLVSVVALLASRYQSRRKNPYRSVSICKSIWVFFYRYCYRFNEHNAKLNCNLIFSNRFSVIDFHSPIVL